MSKLIQDKILSVFEKVNPLEQDDHMLSISRGASIFGFNRREDKNLIEAGYKRNVLLGVSSKQGEKYILLIKKGEKTGGSYYIEDLNLEAILNRRVLFRLYSLNEDSATSVGEVLEKSSKFITLSPLVSHLSYKIY